ncbi:solute carrier family 25 member 16-like [Toxorhynchites rutilus septentrionalis]|uniref:solute carrier family 25 member 16-like n=1 Tax=Toxorhynchites rutilus septentrionalis TaxID=329112 RepID=UPI0024793A7C|nr:solute carrier family 25 member 16-like [Toxorhynchites rutilus septentrionalis]
MESLKSGDAKTKEVTTAGTAAAAPTVMTEATRKNIDFIAKNLLAGGIAGMCSKTAVAPLDRIKILLQAHSIHYKHLGVFSGLKHIVKKESFFALYKGNGAQMVRIFPYAATQFTAFEIYKKYLGKILGTNLPIKHSDKFVAGAGAGVTAVTLTYPLDTIRARLAFQVTGEHRYNGIVHTAVSIFKTEGGIRALYRGFVPTLMGMVPYAGFSFYCFEMLKFVCMKYTPAWTCDKCERNTGGLVLSVPAKLLCGGFAGAVAQSFSYPLDVTRRRMQLAMMNPETAKFGMGMFSTLAIIYRENGIIKGLYRGMSINYLRAIPMVAVSFSTYEVMKQTLNLDTGMKV